MNSPSIPPPGAESWIDRWIFREYALPARSLGIYRIFFAASIILAGVPAAGIGIGSFANGFFNPPFGLTYFAAGFPPYWFFIALSWVVMSCAIFLLFGKLTTFVSVLLSICLFVEAAWEFSFGKIDHNVLMILTPLLLAFAGWGDAYSLDGPRDPEAKPRTGWPLAMLAMALGLAMLSAAMQKANGGWLDWHRHAVRWYLLQFYVDDGQHNILARWSLLHTPMIVWKLQDLITVALEGSLILATIRLRWLRPFLAVACLFHLSIALLLKIDFFANVVVYGAFADWTFFERAPAFARINSSLKKYASSIRAWQLLLAASILAAIFAAIQISSPEFFAGRYISFSVVSIAAVVSWIYIATLTDRVRCRFDGKDSGFPRGQSVILFDGVCGLCNAWVDFVIRRDVSRRFLFTSLQSPTGQNVLRAYGLPDDYLASILVVEDNRLYEGSMAILRILRGLGFPLSPAYALVAVPGVIRNSTYRFIASNRYRWFGKKEFCRMPTEEERTRFV